MSGIEPNLAALGWFAMLSSIAFLAFYVVAGAFPLSERADLAGRPLAIALAAGNALLLALLFAAAVAYGLSHLRWTSVVIVAGFAFLFAPGLMNAWPERWRDGMAGLSIVFAGLIAALVLAHNLGGALTI